jgi:hypothetical protein
MANFNLEKAIAGAMLVKRNGSSIIQFDYLEDEPDGKRVYVTDDTNKTTVHYDNGRYYLRDESGHDLFLED